MKRLQDKVALVFGAGSSGPGWSNGKAAAIAYARDLLQSAKLAPEVVTWNLTHDIGMTCGGEATLLFEIHDPKRWKIAIYGAGHVGQALVRTLESPSAIRSRR